MNHYWRSWVRSHLSWFLAHYSWHYSLLGYCFYPIFGDLNKKPFVINPNSLLSILNLKQRWIVLHVFEFRDTNKSQYFLHFPALFLTIYWLHCLLFYKDIFCVEGQVMSMAVDSPRFILINQDYDPQMKERIVLSQWLYIESIGMDPYWSGLNHKDINQSLWPGEWGTLAKANLLWPEWLSTMNGSLSRSLHNKGGWGGTEEEQEAIAQRAGCYFHKMIKGVQSWPRYASS